MSKTDRILAELLTGDADMDSRLRKAFELGIRYGAAADRESIKRSAQTDQVTRLLIVLMRRQHIDLEQAMAILNSQKTTAKCTGSSSRDGRSIAEPKKRRTNPGIKYGVR